MKTNKQIKMELSKKLAPKIEELVNQRVEDNKKNGVSCSRSYIADQLGIDRNTLNFYINGDNGTGVDAEPRIPDIIGLYKIKNFFCASWQMPLFYGLFGTFYIVYIFYFYKSFRLFTCFFAIFRMFV